MRTIEPPRAPVWMWRAMAARALPAENRRFNRDPITTVEYRLDIDYAGDRLREHRLDVLRPIDAGGPLPVYVYFHGGGWTSGDKAPLTKYCASQAAAGMVVVNANYRMAPRVGMREMLADATAVVRWVRSRIGAYGGDPDRLVLGGDSAGGQIAALTTALSLRPELAAHHGVSPTVEAADIRGLVQHSSLADLSVVFRRGFVMSHGFVRMLLPGGGRGITGNRLERAARYLSPVEWLDGGCPPTFVTSSVRDFLYDASVNLVGRLSAQGVAVDALLLGPEARGARHTWQQDPALPESQTVYRRLAAFVDRVAQPRVA
jgi:acetyl esterase